MFFSFITNRTAFCVLISALCLVGLSLPVYAESPVSDTPIVLAESPVSSAPTVDSPIALEGATEQWSIHGQATYINQFKNNFNFLLLLTQFVLKIV